MTGIVTLDPEAFPFISGVSSAIRTLQRVIADIAATDIPILLLGEDGTGKEIVALELHRRSSNSDKPFTTCNCAVLTAESLKRHFADHRTGAQVSTGANGTTFFQDVHQLDAGTQHVLLQHLSTQDSETSKERLISSSTVNLEKEVRAGQFRQELYYRINGISLRLPSLRQRQDDLPLLLDHFIKKYSSSFERTEPCLSASAKEFLNHYSWPGNVRELENFARKLVILGDEELALSEFNSDSALNSVPSLHYSDANIHERKTRSLKEAAREASRNVERELILESLERTHWNRKRTARELQISYKGLLYKLKQLDIESTRNLTPQSQQLFANGKDAGLPHQHGIQTLTFNSRSRSR